jgi:hypothetical protein
MGNCQTPGFTGHSLFWPVALSSRLTFDINIKHEKRSC